MWPSNAPRQHVREVCYARPEGRNQVDEFSHRVRDFIADAKRGAEAFVALHPYPVLLHDPASAREDPSFDAYSVEGPTNVHVETDAGPRPSAAGVLGLLVIAVRKRSGNAEDGTITVGRAAPADVVVPYTHVSKMHASFTRNEAGEYSLTDAGSANRTYVNGKELSPSVAAPLPERSTISFGGWTYEYLSPREFFELLDALC
jgi:hypothetical protein